LATLTEHRSTEARPEVVVRVDHKRSRRPSLLSLIALAGIGVLVFLGVGFANGWLGLNNLFTTRNVDRSAPVILHRLNNLSSYQAASGTFSVVVDSEKDVSIFPRWLIGSRVQYSAYGAVSASVDLGSLDAQSVTHGAGGGIIVTLPHATLGEAQLNLKHSHVMNRDRGLLDRLGGIFNDNPTSEHALENVAIVKMNRAAKRTHLVERAERNTAKMVKQLASAVGVEQVTVKFGAPKPVAAELH
jgi:Protein of unknown function (DUF4230)